MIIAHQRYLGRYLVRKKNKQTSRDLDNYSLTSLMSYSGKVMKKVVCASELTAVNSVAAVKQTKT